ncbi:hypothetical protein HDV00_005208 [Rhizophlyctis rosea]|nr:hypothetical protein HDV00_005208 [Rhizophlyctis rosea]
MSQHNLFTNGSYRGSLSQESTYGHFFLPPINPVNLPMKSPGLADAGVESMGSSGNSGDGTQHVVNGNRYGLKKENVQLAVEPIQRLGRLE